VGYEPYIAPELPIGSGLRSNLSTMLAA